jgi:WD40 repeat protein
VSTTPVRALAWSPDGRFLAVGTDDGILTLWYPAQSQTPLFSLPLKNTIHSLAWKPNGNQLQLAAASGNAVMLWKVM